MPVLLDPPSVTKGSGDAMRSLAGSGTTIPTSLAKTAFEANGLTFNIASDIDRIRVAKMSGLYDANVRDNRDVNPDRDGETFYGGLYSGKPIIIEGDIWARQYEKWLDMRSALAEAFDPLDAEFPLTGRTGDFTRDWVLYVVKTSDMGMDDYLDGPWFKTAFNIPLRASRPYIFGYQLKSAHGTTQAVVANLGNRNAQPRMLLPGQQQDVVVDVDTTGQQFRLKAGRQIPAGRYYEIDFDAGTVMDDLGVNKFDDYDSASDWLYIPKNATTTFTLSNTVTDGNQGITVYWQDTYK